MYRRILLPTDGSRESELAGVHAVDLAARYGAALSVLHVVETDVLPLDTHSGRLQTAMEEEGRRAVAEAVDRATRRGVERVQSDIVPGVPAERICRYAAETDADLVVMGRHGRSGVDRRVVGSVAERVLRAADVPVLTVCC
jgi:nucleotide-binding universal stress UspA family protein